jgi:hypothetical protein
MVAQKGKKQSESGEIGTEEFMSGAMASSTQERNRNQSPSNSGLLTELSPSDTIAGGSNIIPIQVALQTVIARINALKNKENVPE